MPMNRNGLDFDDGPGLDRLAEILHELNPVVKPEDEYGPDMSISLFGGRYLAEVEFLKKATLSERGDQHTPIDQYRRIYSSGRIQFQNRRIATFKRDGT